MPRKLLSKAALLAGAMLPLSGVTASAADLGLPVQATAAPPMFTWTGCYAGVVGGAGFGQQDVTDSAGILGAALGNTNLAVSGYQIGGEGGCNYQFAPSWVLGIEGGAAGGRLTKQTTFATPGVPGDTTTLKATTDFLASVTARVGYALDRWMLYAKGGAAVAGDKYDAIDALQTYAFEGLENRLGWTAGAGVEWAFSDDWSLKVEYDYYGFGQRSVNFIDNTINVGASGSESVKQNIQTVTVGLNFHVYAGQ
jgi:outer membrane immunogenic protein